jgi:hypothetical protein
MQIKEPENKTKALTGYDIPKKKRVENVKISTYDPIKGKPWSDPATHVPGESTPTSTKTGFQN